MANTVTLQPVAAGGGAPDKPSAATPPRLADYLSGEPDRRLADLLAYALAVEAGPDSPGPEILRGRAEAELANHAARTMHNRIEEIRHEAVRDHVGSIRQPPGLLRLVFANLVALGLAGLGWLWLSQRPDLLAILRGWMGG